MRPRARTSSGDVLTNRQPHPTRAAKRLLTACYLEEDFYDLIDLDMFGSDTTAIGPALDAVRFGGLLYLTSTDGFSSSGKRPQRALAAYGAYTRAHPSANEQGLRMLIGAAVREAAARGLRVRPVVSLFSPHGPVFRAMLRVTRGREDAMQDFGFVGFSHVNGSARTVSFRCAWHLRGSRCINDAPPCEDGSTAACGARHTHAGVRVQKLGGDAARGARREPRRRPAVDCRAAVHRAAARQHLAAEGHDRGALAVLDWGLLCCRLGSKAHGPESSALARTGPGNTASRERPPAATLDRHLAQPRGLWLTRGHSCARHPHRRAASAGLCGVPQSRGGVLVASVVALSTTVSSRKDWCIVLARLACASVRNPAWPICACHSRTRASACQCRRATGPVAVRQLFYIDCKR